MSHPRFLASYLLAVLVVEVVVEVVLVGAGAVLEVALWAALLVLPDLSRS